MNKFKKQWKRFVSMKVAKNEYIIVFCQRRNTRGGRQQRAEQACVY